MKSILYKFSVVFEPWRLFDAHRGKRWHPLLKDVIFGLSLIVVGAAIAVVLTSPWEKMGTPASAVIVGDTKLQLAQINQEALLRLARSKLQATVTLRSLTQDKPLTWAALGAKIDVKVLGELVSNLQIKGISSEATPNLPMPIHLDSEEAFEAILSIKESVDRGAKNARFNFAQSHIEPEQAGLSLDVYSTLDSLDKALASNLNEVDIVVSQVTPRVSSSELSTIEADAVLGYFETRFSRLPKDTNRTYNVKLGASRLDGQVIMPGATFSFNDTLGDRTQARGFRYAPVIAGGVLVEGMGGGTCQVASTLYAASFFAGMIVIDRKPHSRPSSYIKLGLDATVSYPDKNLVLQNPFPFPVVIHFQSQNGLLRAEIRGRIRPYTVTFLRRIVGTDPFPLAYVDDPKVEIGREVITQKGIPGYTVQRYQILEQGKIGYRHRTEDRYPPTKQIIHRGTAAKGSLPEDSDGPREDPHKPYRASKRLRMVQGQDVWYESSHE